MTYYGIMLIPFGMGVALCVYEVITQGEVFGITQFIFLEMVLACLLVWWDTRRDEVFSKIEARFFDRQHEKNILEDLGLNPARRRRL
jgi:hypothetical protein